SATAPWAVLSAPGSMTSGLSDASNESALHAPSESPAVRHSAAPSARRTNVTVCVITVSSSLDVLGLVGAAGQKPRFMRSVQMRGGESCTKLYTAASLPCVAI